MGPHPENLIEHFTDRAYPFFVKRIEWHRLAPWFAAAWLAAHFLFLSSGISGSRIRLEPHRAIGCAIQWVTAPSDSKISATCCDKSNPISAACCHRSCCVEKPDGPSSPVQLPATVPVLAKVAAVIGSLTELWVLPDAESLPPTASAFSPGFAEDSSVPLFLRHGALLI